MLLDVLLDVDISAPLYGFLLDPANLDLFLTKFAVGFLDGPGGGIRARAEICLCTKTRLTWLEHEQRSALFGCLHTPKFTC